MANSRKKTNKVEIPKTTDEMDLLREYVAEAEQVNLLTTHPGWGILARDFKEYKEQIGNKLPYLRCYTPDFEESRILFIASDKALKMVEDYAENRKRAMELLHRLDNPQDNIVLDMDNR